MAEKVIIYLDWRVLEEVDRRASAEGLKRSAFLRRLVSITMNRSRGDESDTAVIGRND